MPIEMKGFQPPKNWTHTNITIFDDVLTAKTQPVPSKSIIFHETSPFKNGVFSLNARQACAVESAARWNPGRSVFILSVAPVGHSNSSNLPIVRALQSYPNIHFRNVNLEKYVAGTPAEQFLGSEKLFKSQFLIEHVADFIRFVTLHKFGGIYLDLDVVVQKSFDHLPPNFSCNQDSSWVSIGAMGFQHDGAGHEIAALCVRDFVSNFNGAVWGHNGPAMLTRVLRKICKKEKVSEMTPEHCWGFKVLPTNAFYPVHYSVWQRYFDANVTSAVLKSSQGSTSVHLWNKLSFNQKVDKSKPQTAYGAIAAKNCPKVFEASGKYF